MVSKHSSSIANEKFPHCHIESQYRSNKFYSLSKSVHPLLQSFIRMCQFWLNFFLVNNKGAWSYMKRHVSLLKQKQYTSNTGNNRSIQEPSSNNCRFVCPFCGFRFDNSNSPSGKKRIEIKCINYNELLSCWKACAYLTRATSHGEKMRKHLCNGKGEQNTSINKVQWTSILLEN